MTKVKKIFNIYIALIFILSLFTDNIYASGISQYYLRVPVGQKNTYERTEDYYNQNKGAGLIDDVDLLDRILGQKVFPDKFSMELLSNSEIVEMAEGPGNKKIEIDLSWTGINGNMSINFIPRDRFNMLESHRPYIKKELNGAPEYRLPEDVTLKELIYFVKEIESLTEGQPGRLKPGALLPRQQDEYARQVVTQYLKANPNLNSEGTLQEEVSSEIITRLEAGIFIKGVEDLYDKLPYIEQPKRLLKDSLPVENWKARLKKAVQRKNAGEELAIIKEVISIVIKYKAMAGAGLNWAPSYVMKTQELNCVSRAFLIARIFKEIGIEQNRIYVAVFPKHFFLVLELSDKSFCAVGTDNKAEAHTKILDNFTAEIAGKLNAQKSVMIELSEPLFGEYGGFPETKFISVSSSLTKGFMSALYINLIVNFYSRGEAAEKKGDDKEAGEFYDITIDLCKRAIRLYGNDPFYYNLLAGYVSGKGKLLEKGKKFTEAANLYNIAIKLSQKAIEFNKNYSDSYFDLGDSFFRKAELMNKNIGLRKESIEAYKKGLELDGQIFDDLAGVNLREFEKLLDYAVNIDRKKISDFYRVLKYYKKLLHFLYEKAYREEKSGNYATAIAIYAYAGEIVRDTMPINRAASEYIGLSRFYYSTIAKEAKPEKARRLRERSSRVYEEYKREIARLRKDDAIPYLVDLSGLQPYLKRVVNSGI